MNNSLTHEALLAQAGEDFLQHFGVKGMKWGVRNQDRSTTETKVEVKAQKRETKAQKFEVRVVKAETRVLSINKELDALPPGVKTSYKRASLNRDRNQLEQFAESNRRDAERVREGKLTTNQKYLLAGAAVAGTALVAYGLYNAKESGQLNSLALRGQALMKGEKFDFKRNDLFAKASDPDSVLNSVVKGINPNYATKGGHLNCRRASFAYELRRRGYDVVATPTSIGSGQTESGLINAITQGKKKIGSTSIQDQVQAGKGLRAMLSGDNRINPADTFSLVAKAGEDARGELGLHTAFGKKILDSFSDMPDGSRGEGLFHFGGFGHSMSWEMFNGKPIIFDAQKAQKYDISDEFDWHQLTAKWGHPKAFESTRLDNMKLDNQFLSRWATNTSDAKVKKVKGR